MLTHAARAPFHRRFRTESLIDAPDPLAMRRRQLPPSPSTWPETARPATSRNALTVQPRSALLSWLALALSLISTSLLWMSTPSAAGRPQLHLFAAPKPFVGIDAHHQLRALKSWLALRPRPHITLLGSGFNQIARRYGVRSHAVDTTFLGVPLFSAVVAAANATQPSNADVVVLLNADIVLFDDFSIVITKLRRVFGTSWLALGGRWDIDQIPHSPRFRLPRAARLLAARVRDLGTLHTYGGVDVWAWPAGSLPSVHGGVPPFVLGRGRYDNWFTHALLQQASNTVDISEAATLTHVRHDHHLVTGDSSSHEQKDQPYWTADPAKRFELYVNAHLAATRGTFFAQQGTVLHAPFKLSPCYERRITRCLFRRRRPHTCRCEHAPFVGSAMSDPYVVEGSRIILCGLRSTDAVDGLSRHQIAARWPVSGRAGMHKPAFGLPLLSRDLLEVVRARVADGVVLLVVAAAGEETLMANTVCAARRVGAFPRLIIAALDNDLYRFGMLHGWPVFLEGNASSGRTTVMDRLRAAHALVARGAAVVVVPAGAILRRNITAHLSQIVERRADVAVSAHAGVLYPGLLFARGSRRAARLLQKAMRSRTASLRALERAACGAGGLATAGGLCESGDAILQILGLRDCTLLQTRDAHSDAAVVVPDERESAGDKIERLRSNGLIRFDDDKKLCAHL